MQTVGPRDCGLAIALPLTRERFLEQLHQPERYDYASYIRDLSASAGASDDYYWSYRYERFASAMAKRCDAVERQGVRVVRDVTAASLRELFESCPVVTLVAHSCFDPLLPEEIVDARRLVMMLRHPPNGLVQAFRRQLDTVDPLWLSNAEDSGRLVEAINRVLAAGHQPYHQGAHTPLFLQDIPPVRLTRPALERAFGGVLAAGSSVELADGLTTIGGIAALIPASFRGLLDLTICNSAILGDAIKHLRPSCIVAVNRYPTEPHIRLALYRQTIEELARAPRPFAVALTRVITGKETPDVLDQDAGPPLRDCF